MPATPDIVIIGSGMGGATAAFALAPTGARILILEKGHQLPATPENRDARAIFQRGHFRPKEFWYDSAGAPFNPGNYYNHGGNSKFYGAVLARYRAEDFDGDRACRRRCAALAVPLSTRSRPGTTAPNSSIRSGARRRGPDRAAARHPLPPSAGAGRAGHRRGARAAETARAAPVLAAARRRHRPAGSATRGRRGMPFRTRAAARWTRRPARCFRRWNIRTSRWRAAPRCAG